MRAEATPLVLDRLFEESGGALEVILREECGGPVVERGEGVDVGVAELELERHELLAVESIVLRGGSRLRARALGLNIGRRGRAVVHVLCLRLFRCILRVLPLLVERRDHRVGRGWVSMRLAEYAGVLFGAESCRLGRGHEFSHHLGLVYSIYCRREHGAVCAFGRSVLVCVDRLRKAFSSSGPDAPRRETRRKECRPGQTKSKTYYFQVFEGFITDHAPKISW